MIIIDHKRYKQFVSHSTKGVTKSEQFHKLIIIDLDRAIGEMDKNVNLKDVYKFAEDLPALLILRKHVYYSSKIGGGTYFIFDHFSRYDASENERRMLLYTAELKTLIQRNRDDEIVVCCASDFLSFKKLEEIFSDIDDVEFYGNLQHRFERIHHKLKTFPAGFLNRHEKHRVGDHSTMIFSPKNLCSSFTTMVNPSDDFRGVLFIDSLSDNDRLNELCELYSPRMIVSQDLPTTANHKVFKKHSVYHIKL